LAATVQLTVPVPAPLPPAVIVINGALLPAIQAQLVPLAVMTMLLGASRRAVVGAGRIIIAANN
jgi:hypothetical protein